MSRISALAVILVIGGMLAQAQSGKSPYAGQESLEIKSLTVADVEAYLAGDGMGLAKAAELNHYPGPRHVLELASALQLSQEQISRTGQIHSRMQAEAIRLGTLLVDKERHLDRLFAEGRMKEMQLEALVREIGRLLGELRLVHLRAHLEMRQLLRPEQITRYDALRGYQAGKPHQHRQH